MKTVVIDNENRMHFQNLISTRIREGLDDPAIFSLGAVDENGTAVGALVCALTEDGAAEIVWLFVAEERRLEGAARLLLHTLYDSLRELGREELFCLFPEEETEPLAELLLDLGFVLAEEAEDLTTVPVAALAERLAMVSLQKVHCLPLREIPFGLVTSLLRTTEDAPLLGAYGADRSAFHPCSCGIMENGGLTGVILFYPHEDSEGAALVTVQAQNSTQALQMLRFSADQARRMLPENAGFTIATMNGLGMRLRELLPEQAQAIPLLNARIALQQ